jgi:glycosyltransferase A (GT-A) superfamily protein (DUF2064 family)
MTAGAAIFVKTPGHSPVKSRLAEARGAAWAEEWYRGAAMAVAAVARSAAPLGITTYWAVAEPVADVAGAWPGLPIVAQGEGGLGERMGRVHAELVARYGAGLLLGADAPQVTRALLAEATAWLDAPVPRLVLGPAHDGGFWLFGANVAPPLETWSTVAYSAADTARRFRAALAPLGEWRMIDTLTDADHAGDLPAVLAALERLSAPLPEQAALAAWMRDRGVTSP